MGATAAPCRTCPGRCERAYLRPQALGARGRGTPERREVAVTRRIPARVLRRDETARPGQPARRRGRSVLRGVPTARGKGGASMTWTTHLEALARIVQSSAAWDWSQRLLNMAWPGRPSGDLPGRAGSDKLFRHRTARRVAAAGTVTARCSSRGQARRAHGPPDRGGGGHGRARGDGCRLGGGTQRSRPRPGSTARPWWPVGHGAQRLSCAPDPRGGRGGHHGGTPPRGLPTRPRQPGSPPRRQAFRARSERPSPFCKAGTSCRRTSSSPASTARAGRPGRPRAGGELQHAARLGRRAVRERRILRAVRREGHPGLAGVHLRLRQVSRPPTRRFRQTASRREARYQVATARPPRRASSSGAATTSWSGATGTGATTNGVVTARLRAVPPRAAAAPRRGGRHALLPAQLAVLAGPRLDPNRDDVRRPASLVRRVSRTRISASTAT